ncbi:hypothetical protein K439DRAFT_1323461, partial [Ramaria rubella]
ILGVVADNASNNNMMLNTLNFELKGFQGSLTRVRCIGHIFNLCVKVCIFTQVLNPQPHYLPLLGNSVSIQPQEVWTCTSDR